MSGRQAENGERRGRADAFASLGPAVRDALSERGFSTPTEPQRLAIPPLARGEHTLVVAPTGTGKTETAMLPVFDAIAEREGRPEGISALYITPLRALNRDMRDRLDWWGEELGIEIDVRHGDTTDYQRRKQATDPPDVLVTTPETLQAMFTGKRLRAALEDVEHVVVDEVHELAASKRGAQLAVGLERLRALAGPFQRIGLSATVGDPEAVAGFLTGSRECAIREVDVGSRIEFDVIDPEIRPEDADLAGELVTTEELASHVRAIIELVEANESTLIFVNTRQTAEALGSRFKRIDANVGVHHGSLSADARVDVEDRFKAGELDGLLCTSSMELGIDVGHVDHVVQYRSPRQVTRLLQRVGRAGHRRDRVSRGTIVTDDPEDSLEALAIARRAAEGAVEPARIHEGSLDVVANQLAALAMEREEVAVAEAHGLIRRAAPFGDLEEATTRTIVEELRRNRVIWFDEPADRIESSGGTWQYVYANLSMIPDEETYEVRDVAGGGTVGTLDERFVRTFAEPGEVFVQRGEMWRIVAIEDDEATVRVTPIEDPAGEVPSWIGQEIPVPRSVAAEVGEMRAVAASQFERNGPREAVAREFASRYPASPETFVGALEDAERHADVDAPVPTEDRLVIEARGRALVLSAPLGHTVNETLGRLVAALVGQRTGSSVAMDADPYRIEFEIPGSVSPEAVESVLRETDPGHVEPLLELSLKGSQALAMRLAQVAAKFGALDRSADGSVSGERLLSMLEDTPMYEEAIREFFHEELAVEAAAELLAAIQSGEVAVELVGERTPIGSAGRSTGRELLAPENADASVIETVRERLRDDSVILLCVHCTEYRAEKPVRRVREQPRCPHCESTMIAALNPWDEETVEAVRAGERDDEQAASTERAYRAASLVQAHGKRAVIALAARGVGPHNAARIINRLREDEESFYRDILEREREYARTKSFWD